MAGHGKEVPENFLQLILEPVVKVQLARQERGRRGVHDAFRNVWSGQQSFSLFIHLVLHLFKSAWATDTQ